LFESFKTETSRTTQFLDSDLSYKEANWYSVMVSPTTLSQHCCSWRSRVLCEKQGKLPTQNPLSATTLQKVI